MTNIDSILKSRDITLPTEVCLVSSVQFSHSVVSNSLWPPKLQHVRPPCPSPTPRVDPDLCPLSQWCHPTISSSVIPFSFCPQSFPASASFQMSQLFISGELNWTELNWTEMWENTWKVTSTDSSKGNSFFEKFKRINLHCHCTHAFTKA